MFRVPHYAQKRLNRAAIKMIDVRHGNVIARSEDTPHFERQIAREPRLQNDFLDSAVSHHENLKQALETRDTLKAEYEALACAHNVASLLLEPKAEQGVSEYDRKMYSYGLNPALVPTLIKGEVNAFEFSKAYDLGIRNYLEYVSTDFARLKLGEEFARKSWTPQMIAKLRFVAAPRTAETIATVWQLAIEEV